MGLLAKCIVYNPDDSIDWGATALVFAFFAVLFSPIWLGGLVVCREQIFEWLLHGRLSDLMPSPDVMHGLYVFGVIYVIFKATSWEWWR